MDTDSARRKLSEHNSPVLLEYSLMKEFVYFQQQGISNVYVVPSHLSAFRWFGVIFIHEGIYRGIVLRFTLEIPESYPYCECPKIFFRPVPYHPLVNPESGELTASHRFQCWNWEENRIGQLILFAKSCFGKIDDVLDGVQMQCNSFYTESLQLYKTEPATFQAKVNESIEECLGKMYDPVCGDDPNAIQFGPWNPETHEEFRKKLISGKSVVDELGEENAQNRNNGLSWVQKGSLRLFSKTVS